MVLETWVGVSDPDSREHPQIQISLLWPVSFLPTSPLRIEIEID